MKFSWKMNKEKLFLLLLAGVVLLILAIPTGNTKKEKAAAVSRENSASPAAGVEKTYEEQLELRVREILKHVDGVGKVDVMIVLKSSEEKILRVDKNSTNSVTEENDSAGGSRKVTNDELSETTILTGNGADSQPVVEKEIRPEIEGIIISATGGGSPTVKAEISAAMEALFNVPPHKIKVLKRVE